MPHFACLYAVRLDSDQRAARESATGKCTHVSHLLPPGFLISASQTAIRLRRFASWRRCLAGFLSSGVASRLASNACNTSRLQPILMRSSALTSSGDVLIAYSSVCLPGRSLASLASSELRPLRNRSAVCLLSDSALAIRFSALVPGALPYRANFS